MSDLWFRETAILNATTSGFTTNAGSSGPSGVATVVGSPVGAQAAATPTQDTIQPGKRLKRSYAHLGMSACLPSRDVVADPFFHRPQSYIHYPSFSAIQPPGFRDRDSAKIERLHSTWTLRGRVQGAAGTDGQVLLWYDYGSAGVQRASL